MGHFFYAGFLLLCELLCNVRDIAAFVAFASVRHWCKIRRVGLKYYSFKRNVLDGFGYCGLFVSQDSSDADVPVSEFLEFMERLRAAAVGMEDALELKMFVIF